MGSACRTDGVATIVCVSDHSHAAAAPLAKGERHPIRRRPKNRKAQIITAAADQFYNHGFHSVRAEDIATSVGITAGALYRHFRNKQELLSEAIEVGLQGAAEVVAESAPDDVAAMIDRMVEPAVEQHNLGVLWTREARHLSAEQRQRLTDRFRVIPAHIAAILRAARPELSAPDADLLAWVMLGVLTAPSYNPNVLPADQMRSSVKQLASATWQTDVSGDAGAQPDADRSAAVKLRRESRREALLDAAVSLFSQRGYHAVSMEDIGAAVGISGASVYNHFPAKTDLLFIPLVRAAGSLQLGVTEALRNAERHEDALSRVLASYIDLALGHPALITLLVSETMNLPAAQLREVRELQHHYVAEWTSLLHACYPRASVERVRFTVHVCLTCVNDVARTRRLRAQPGIRQRLRDVGWHLLNAVDE